LRIARSLACGMVSRRFRPARLTRWFMTDRYWLGPSARTLLFPLN
jgi:hypothetical protein